MKLIYVCSPFSGDVDGNVKRAKDYCKFVLSEGNVPLAPHLLFPQFLNDNVESERELAMSCNFEILNKCDELWVFGDKISRGMKQEIQYATDNDKPILTFINFEY